MLLEIPKVLDQDKLENIRKVLEHARFQDGRLSAGEVARRVKRNEELDQQSQQARYLDQLVVSSLAANASFRNGALPHRVSQPFFARYGPGMTYGDHIDDPVMGPAGQRFRTDLAVTVFLNEPDDYQGGELVINTPFGQNTVKLKAGSAVMYPASSVHRVAEVTGGQRLVAVLWVQSMVRDPARRELLYELSLAREALLAAGPEEATAVHVDHAYVNLVRMWSEV